jgi:hypothetical protein
MPEFMIVIERQPGEVKSEEHFAYTCDTAEQAWDYARDKWRVYGPMSRVKSVTKLPVLVCVPNDNSGYDVIDKEKGEVTARLVPTPWGRWKIVGEDTYANTPLGLYARLQLRQRMLSAMVAPPPP